MADNVSRLLRSPKTIRARLTYESPPLPPQPPPVQPNVTIHSQHAFLTDKYNPIPVSLSSYTRTILTEPTSLTSPKTLIVPESSGDEKQKNIPDVQSKPETQYIQTEPIQPVDLDELKNTFVQRKEERDKCFNEFSEFVSKSFSATVSPKISTLHRQAATVGNLQSVRLEVNNNEKQLDLSKPSTSVNVPFKSIGKVTSKSATLKLSPREMQTRTITICKRKPVQAVDTKPPPPQVRQKSTQEIPRLKIVSSRASSINQDTDRAGQSATDGHPPRNAYDSARARKFMAEQQKKRKLESKTVNVQEKCAIAERKRRLAELQLNTRKIVQRNLRQRPGKSIAGGAAKSDKMAEEVSTTQRDDHQEDSQPATTTRRARPFIEEKVQNRRGPDRGAIHFSFPLPTPTEKVVQTPSTEANIQIYSAAPIEPSQKSDTAALTPLIQAAHIDMRTSMVTMPQCSVSANSCNRRCGILRRTDASPNNSQRRIPSPMNIHFDQLIAPSLGAEVSPLTNTLDESQPFGNRLSNAANIAAADLQIPDVHLQTSAVAGASNAAESANEKEESATRKTSGKEAAKNVPFWLRPSPIQPYPYNFIMAVRKKLDMIANPQLGAAKRAQQAKKEPASPRGRVSYFKKKNCAVTAYRQKSKGTAVQDISAEVQNALAEASKSAANSDSEATLTNLSSVSLQLPPTESQSVCDQWPAPQQVQNVAAKAVNSDSDSQATLSISSTIFSQSSPDKKQTVTIKPTEQPTNVEPLSTEIIADMRLVSRRRPIPSFPFVSRRRGSVVPSAVASSSKTSRTATSQSSSSQQEVANPGTLNETNLIDMLDSFNRSLSHAISINQRLHDTLHKPVQVHRSVASGPDTSASALASASAKSNADEYSSNFESSSIATKISQSISLLENESSIKSSSVPTTATSRSSATATESVRTEMSQQGCDSTSKTSSSSKSTLIDTNQSLASATTNSARPEQIVSIRTQLDSSGQPTTNNSSLLSSGVARNLEHSFVATLNAPNSPGPSSSVRIPAPSTVTSIRSSSSSTLTITSARPTAHLMPLLPYVEDDDKENVSLNTKLASTEARKHKCLTVDQQQQPIVDLNQSIGSDIFAVFNQTDIEYSELADGNLGVHSATSTTTIVSDTANVSYSTLGMYDQLLKTEDQKSLDLTALLKTREKALMDRTKGQIAWLELQKQKYQERGLTTEILAVKKKQRALLMQLERERAELAKSAKQSTAVASRPRHSAVLRLSQMHAPRMRRASCPLVATVASGQQITPMPAMRAIDFAADNNVEMMLQEREGALRQRRAHVESLVRWHQRLDEEESTVAAMESQLMARTNQMRMAPPPQIAQADTPRSRPSTSAAHRYTLSRQQQRQIMDIEQSLEVLQAMPSVACGRTHQSAAVTADRAISGAADQHDDSVSVRGAKLNRLWRRLTGDRSCKFIPERAYDLSKTEIAQVYEDAKRYVLAQFSERPRESDDGHIVSDKHHRHRHRLQVLDQTQLSAASLSASSVQQPASATTMHSGVTQHSSTNNCIAPQAHHHHHIACDEFIVVPALNLNFTSTEEQSCSASETEGDGGANTRTSGYYFTDSVQPMSVHRETSLEGAANEAVEDEHSRKRSRVPSQDDVSVEEEMSSAKTFRRQLGRGHSLRDSAFSVDSLNSSRPELSEAATLPPPSSAAKNDVSDEPAQSATILPATTVAGDASTTLTSALIYDLRREKTVLIADTTCTTLLGNSMCIAEELSLSTSVDAADTASSLATSIGEDKPSDAVSGSGVSATDNDHLLQQSYSDGFEAATLSTIRSDKIGEAIGMSAAALSSSSSLSSASTATRQVEDSLSEQLPTSALTIATVESGSSTVAGSRSEDTSMTPYETPATGESDDGSKSIDKEISEIAPVAFTVGSASVGGAEAVSTTFEMPDIISEAEVLRRQQMRIEEEIKQLEENAAVPFYIREIPNKPPPPYVPPAHGSPMTAIFPSDERIREIVFDRVKQLYNAPRQQHQPATYASSSFPENITNIYERIALDICAECLDEIQLTQLPDAAPNPSSSATATSTTNHFKHPLAFYNPPDRLLCMQQHVLRQVKRLLRHPNAVHSSPPPSAQAAAVVPGSSETAAAQPTTKRLIVATTVTSTAGSNGGGSSLASGLSAKRRLWWNEIVLHEMMEDDATWTNFDAERSEVLSIVSNEIVDMLLQEAVVDCERAHDRKVAAQKRAKSGKAAASV